MCAVADKVMEFRLAKTLCLNVFSRKSNFSWNTLLERKVLLNVWKRFNVDIGKLMVDVESGLCNYSLIYN